MSDPRPKFKITFTEIQWDLNGRDPKTAPPTEFTSEWLHASRAQVAIQMALNRMYHVFNCNQWGVIDCTTTVEDEKGQRFRLDPSDRSEDPWGRLIPIETS